MLEMEAQRLRKSKKLVQGHKTSQMEELGFTTPQCSIESHAPRVYRWRTQLASALIHWSLEVRGRECPSCCGCGTWTFEI